MVVELKDPLPCPFCGSTRLAITNKDNLSARIAVQCRKCGSQSPTIYATWNDRITENQLKLEIHQLKVALKKLITKYKASKKV